ncbi:MAG: FAD:protein FMN transferase [Patescibacteria group bacterium]|nr:FAD:protein FMN transferase [Patescibacteria group bacterium]
MKDTRLIMGMPITVEIVDLHVENQVLESVFNYFTYIDEKFSTYKETSEIMKINRGEINENDYSEDMKEIFQLAEKTKIETNNFFNIKKPDGSYDPSGIVKGWAIQKASDNLKNNGYNNFCLDAGGDIQTSGKNSKGEPWTIGIRNPLNTNEIIKIINNKNNKGIATSGTYIRGNHIYNPNNKDDILSEVLSLTVIGPNIYEADRFATAAFAMGKDGIYFIDKLVGFEGYMIDTKGIATMTRGFEEYTQ